MSSTGRFGWTATICGLMGLFALSQAQAQESVAGGYDAVNNKMILIINNASPLQNFTNVTLTETLIADPMVTDSVAIGTIAAGTSATSDKDFLFPITFGDNPATLFSGFPIDFMVTFTSGGFTQTQEFNQDNNLTGGYVQFTGIGENGNPDFAAVPLTTIAAVPEPGTPALLLGIGTFGATVIRRQRARKR